MLVVAIIKIREPIGAKTILWLFDEQVNRILIVSYIDDRIIFWVILQTIMPNALWFQLLTCGNLLLLSVLYLCRLNIFGFSTVG